MAFNTTNSAAVIEQEVYSRFIVENLHDGLLPDSFSRNVADFGSGERLNIPVIGSATVQDVEEEVPMTYNAIDTGRVYLNITDYVGDAWSVSDILRQDGYMVESLMSERAKEGTRALQEHFETRFFEAANAGQTATDPNTINGFAHRIGSSETSDLATLDHFRQMKLAFDKAKVPQGGRVAFVDPVVEATLNALFTMTAPTSGSTFNFNFEGLVRNGFERDHRFVASIFGWDVWTTNYLPRGDFTGVSDADGTTSETISGAVANIFMCIGSDSTKPVMRAWRMPPKTENRRNFELKRDEYDIRARFGLGVQRTDTLGVLITSASNY